MLSFLKSFDEINFLTKKKYIAEEEDFQIKR